MLGEGGGGGLTSDSKWGKGVKTPFCQKLFIIFKNVGGGGG